MLYFLKSAEVKIVSLDQHLFAPALDMYQTHQDKEWGLTDCVSFVVMLEENLIEALTFDYHLTELFRHYACLRQQN